jgi:hypothetical protein
MQWFVPCVTGLEIFHAVNRLDGMAQCLYALISRQQPAWELHLNLHDSQAQIRRISPVFAQKRRQDRQAQESRNVFIACGGEETRASRAVFQTRRLRPLPSNAGSATSPSPSLFTICRQACDKPVPGSEASSLTDSSAGEFHQALPAGHESKPSRPPSPGGNGENGYLYRRGCEHPFCIWFGFVEGSTLSTGFSL